MKNPRLIEGEAPFQVEKRAFALSKSESGYVLQCNAKYNDGDDIIEADWSDYSDSIEGGYATNVECPAGLWWRLKGNTGNVYLQL